MGNNTQITTDWDGNPIGIGTLVNVDNGANVKNKSGVVTEVIFKGDTRDEIYVRVSGIKNLNSVRYVTVLNLDKLEKVVYGLFTKHGVSLSIDSIKEATQAILEAIESEDTQEG